MYGLEQIYLAVPPIGAGSPYATGIGHGPKRKMTSEHNTSISAIGALFMTGPNETHLHVYHNRFAHVPLKPTLLGNRVAQFEIGEPTTGGASGWREIVRADEPYHWFGAVAPARSCVMMSARRAAQTRARLLEHLRAWTSTDSATTERIPLGPASRATVAMR